MPEMPQLQVHCNAPVGPLHIEVDFTTTHPWTVLFGPSGSGKSTLLRLLAGLWRPRNQSVHLGDDNLTQTPPHKRNIALVAQQPALFPHMTAQENVAFALAAASRTHNSAKLSDEAIHLLHAFHADHAINRRPRQLSGGETKRVALARAIASAPRMLLLDEVFTGMHRSQREQLLQHIRTYCGEHGIPVLSVTHDLPEAMEADEVLRIEAGHIIARGHPQEVLAEECAAWLQNLPATIVEKQ